MPEALARSHNDSILSRPARNASGKGRPSLARLILRRLMTRPARTIAGATLAAVLTGIVLNALVMQKERRTTPFFAAPKPAAAAAAPAPASEAAVPVQPPARPANLATPTPTPAPVPPARDVEPQRAGDPIRDLLRADAGKDANHLVLAAQNALVKLGYSIKADGVIGASTEQAIQQFQRAHNLTPSSEITPHLVKQLVAAANAVGH